MDPSTDPKSIVGSILKASRLLDSFSIDRREISLQEFTKDTGLNKTTAYRMLQTLVVAEWLVRTPSGGYRLGMRLFYLGAIVRADLDLRTLALPLMRELTDEFGDTVFLMIPGPEGAVTIETVVGTNPVRVHGVTVGSVLPYHVAAGPVVLAAFDPDLEERVLKSERVKMTAQTTTTKAELKARFAEVRQTGYSVSMEDYVDEVAAVAAPVLNAEGVAVASLSLGGPSNRFKEPMLPVVIERVRKAAEMLSARMGY